MFGIIFFLILNCEFYRVPRSVSEQESPKHSDLIFSFLTVSTTRSVTDANDGVSAPWTRTVLL